MVYTVTFNPALDYVVRMDSFQAGETNRTESDELQWGGKGINVSTVLRNLGVDNVALGFLAGWLEHRDYIMAHKLGAATGSATAFSDGLATKDHVMALLNTF